MKKSKWFWYTLCIGLLPMVIRGFISLFSNFPINFINIGDLIFFGLVLSITNINELEYVNVKRSDDKRKKWKTRSNALSILFICWYSTFYVLIVISENNQQLFKLSTILNVTIMLNCVNIIFSISNYSKLKIENI